MLPRASDDQPRLSVIDENSDALLPASAHSPPVAAHRPMSKRWRDAPSDTNSERSPPMYSVWDVSGPRGEKLMDMRNNKYLSRRGGWKRLCLIFLVVAIPTIALGVGLRLGLHKNQNQSR